MIDLVKSKLENEEYKLVNYHCPCSNQDNDAIITEIDRYGLQLTSVLCLNCGTVRINPYLDEASLDDFYTNIYRKMYAMDIHSGGYDDYFLSQAVYAEKMLRVSQDFLNSDSWICEVGCGGGGALKVFQDKGYNAVGCDYDLQALEVGRQKGVKNLYYGSLDTVTSNLDGIKFDLIYLHHVFEHLSDPVGFLKDCQRSLSPKGRIILVVPDISKIDQFGHPAAVGNLLMYLHIAHKYNFSLEGLRQLSGKAGYSVDKLNPDRRIKTSWSKAPELWVQLQADLNISKAQYMGDKASNKAASDMLEYLQRTEKLYSFGFCRGQILNKLKSAMSPERWLIKLKKLFYSAS